MLRSCVEFKELLIVGISSCFVGVKFKEAAAARSYCRICFNPIVSPSTYSKWSGWLKRPPHSLTRCKFTV